MSYDEMSAGGAREFWCGEASVCTYLSVPGWTSLRLGGRREPVEFSQLSSLGDVTRVATACGRDYGAMRKADPAG